MGKSTVASTKHVRELLLSHLGTQIDELRVREPGARIDSPDAVHRMRVACRRLRSSLATFGPLFAGPQAQHLRGELKWLGSELGGVRDVEVMRAHLNETVAILPVDADLAKVLAEVDRELAERHSHAHQNLIEALNSPRYAASLTALMAFVTYPQWDPKAAPRHTLPSLVGRACDRVDHAAKTAEGMLDLAGPELHEVRKAAKRARYAAEVAAPLAGSAAQRLARRMEDLQELLGRHQDSLMARALLDDLASRMLEYQAFALGVLTGVEHASDESVLAEYGHALDAASADDVRAWTHSR